LILDSCYSGTAIDVFKLKAAHAFEAKALEKGMYIKLTICCAARADELAEGYFNFEVPSPFTKHLFQFNDDDTSPRDWFIELIKGNFEEPKFGVNMIKRQGGSGPSQHYTYYH
jgi:hypothetical protein